MLRLDQTDVHEEWKQQVRAKKLEYGKKTTRQKYAKSEQYKTFKERIYVRTLLDTRT
jgi:hypothetical protein